MTSLNDACDLVLEVTRSTRKPVHQEERPGEVKHAYCLADKATNLLGYRTKHQLKNGLVKMFNWAEQLRPQEPTYILPLQITKRAPRVWVEKFM